MWLAVTAAVGAVCLVLCRAGAVLTGKTETTEKNRIKQKKRKSSERKRINERAQLNCAGGQAVGYGNRKLRSFDSRVQA